MDSESARKLLDILIENALRIMEAGFGVNRAESAFFDVVSLLREDITLKGYFLERVASTLALRDPGRLDTGMLPRELIELVAHETRWEEIRELAEKRIRDLFRDNRAFAVGDIAESVVGAYDDNWGDREFYKRYDAAATSEGKN